MKGNLKSEIRDWKDCDRAMTRLGQIVAELGVERANADALIQRTEEAYLNYASGLDEERESLEKSLRKFAGGHKKEFRARDEGGDTRSYAHGGVEIGFRRTPPQVRIEDEESAVEWLRKREFGVDFVRTRVEPNREALREALSCDSDPIVEKMAAHGITLQSKDKFFVECEE